MSATGGSKKICEQLKKGMGKVVNIFATTANSPAALNALMGIKGAMKRSALSPLAQEAVALLVGEIHGCAYCRAAHWDGFSTKSPRQRLR